MTLSIEATANDTTALARKFVGPEITMQRFVLLLVTYGQLRDRLIVKGAQVRHANNKFIFTKAASFNVQ